MYNKSSANRNNEARALRSRVQPRRVDCRRCGQQPRPSTSFVDNTIDLIAVAKFSKPRVWDKVPEGSRPTLFWKYPNFPITQSRQVDGSSQTKNQPDSFTRFSITPVCDRQADTGPQLVPRYRSVAR